MEWFFEKIDKTQIMTPNIHSKKVLGTFSNGLEKTELIEKKDVMVKMIKI